MIERISYCNIYHIKLLLLKTIEGEISLFEISLKIIATMISVYIIFTIRKTFAIRPKHEFIKSLQGKNLIRYASKSIIVDENHVKIPTTDSYEHNITSFFKPVTWFFIEDPTTKNIAKNNISSSEIKIVIPFSNFDSSKILYREFDSVVGYLENYEGQAHIIESDLKSRKNLRLLRLYYKFIMAPFDLAVFLFILCVFFGLDLGIKVFFGCTLLLVLIVIISRIRKYSIKVFNILKKV